MILIAESGSTKCDWVVLNSDGTEHKRFSTMGFNPYFHSASFINEELSENEVVKTIHSQVEFVYFYGAGASSESLKDIVKDGLQQVLPNAQVNVDHDLVASAYSTYTGEPAITCILGTGSNSCFFDGASFGAFENDSDMAVNLGFSGFRRGSYDFYKSDWKYLNDGALYGAMLDTTASSADTRGCLFFHQDALVMAEQMAVRSQTQYKQEYLSTLFTSDTLYGVETLSKV